MRVTNSMMTNRMMLNINRNMTSLDKLYTQYASGKRINRPSDDPILASRALKFRTNVTETKQYQRNSDQSLSWMNVTESAFNNGYNILTKIREIAVSGASDVPLTSSDRQELLTELEQLMKQVGSEMNVTYSGRYVFSGYRTDQPYTLTANQPDASYSIFQTFSASDIQYTKSYRKLDETGTPEIHEVAILKLPYTNMGDVNIPGYKVNTVSYYSKTQDPYVVADGEINYIPETGELVLGTQVAKDFPTTAATASAKLELTMPTVPAIVFDPPAGQDFETDWDLYKGLLADYEIRFDEYKAASDAYEATYKAAQDQYKAAMREYQEVYDVWEQMTKERQREIDRHEAWEDYDAWVAAGSPSDNPVKNPTNVFGTRPTEAKPDPFNVEPPTEPKEPEYNPPEPPVHPAVPNNENKIANYATYAGDYDDYLSDYDQYLDDFEEYYETGGPFEEYLEGYGYVDYDANGDIAGGGGYIKDYAAHIRDVYDSGAVPTSPTTTLPDATDSSKYTEWKSITSIIPPTINDPAYLSPPGAYTQGIPDEYAADYNAYLKEVESFKQDVDTYDGLRDQYASFLKSNGNVFSVQYNKNGLAQGDLNPLVVFNTRDLNDDNKIYTMDDQELNYIVGVNTTVQVNTLGKDVYTDKLYADLMNFCQFIASIDFSNEDQLIQKYSGAPHNLTGDDLAKAVKEQQTLEEQMARSALQDRFSDMLSLLDKHTSKISTEQSNLGARMSRVDLISERLQEDEASYEELLSKTEDADVVEVIMNLQIASSVYQAALQAGSKIIQMTLADYIR